MSSDGGGHCENDEPDGEFRIAIVLPAGIEDGDGIRCLKVNLWLMLTGSECRDHGRGKALSDKPTRKCRNRFVCNILSVAPMKAKLGLIEVCGDRTLPRPTRRTSEVYTSV